MSIFQYFSKSSASLRANQECPSVCQIDSGESGQTVFNFVQLSIPSPSSVCPSHSPSHILPWNRVRDELKSLSLSPFPSPFIPVKLKIPKTSRRAVPPRVYYKNVKVQRTRGKRIDRPLMQIAPPPAFICRRIASLWLWQLNGQLEGLTALKGNPRSVESKHQSGKRREEEEI